MEGRIIKGVGGFYYVDTGDDRVYECRARGLFRKEKKKPLVGDKVEMVVTDPKDMEGSIVRIHDRVNSLIRPEVANVDQVLAVFCVSDPAPSLTMIDRYLSYMHTLGIDAALGINKIDLDPEGASLSELKDIYRGCGCPILPFSVKDGTGVEELLSFLKGKTTVIAGPSGAGKSSLVNLIFPGAKMEVGEISRKLERGRHTTRHSQLFCMGGGTYITDTPGFGSFFLQNASKEDVRDSYPEFYPYRDKCYFRGCFHFREPDCAVKEAVEQELISRVRYETYLTLLNEVE